MMFYSNDPARDAARHDAEQQRRLDNLPRCCYCDEPIQDEYAYLIDGEWICEECMKEQFRVPVCY
jgi:formylmethanofuran dehydrogenase subunit E